MSARARRIALPAFVLCLGVAALVARADWLQPDASYREAQADLRGATRDTIGQSTNIARLDTLGLALLRLGRTPEATKIFRRVLELSPDDKTAPAALGKLALFAGRLDQADSLLAAADPGDPGAELDRFVLKLRREDWAGAAALAPDVGQPGRVPMLERFAEAPVFRVVSGPAEVRLLWARTWPVPLIRVKLEGESVLMGLDSGASDVLVDESAARRLKLARPGAEWPTFWMGSRLAVRGAIVRKLELGGMKIENVPVGTCDLQKWSLGANPQGERVAGVIGVSILRRFCSTLDYANSRLVLRRDSTAFKPSPTAARVPFQIWGEDEIMVSGAIGGGRRLAMVLQTGLPGAGIGAPSEVFDEFGLKPGAMAKLMKNAGGLSQGRPWSEVGVPAVSVGPILGDHVDGWSGALDSGELWRHGIRRDAIVGGQFFKGRSVTFDWKRQELVVEHKD